MERDPCRRPIEPDEAPRLAELGQTLRGWRLRAGMTQRQLAEAVAMSELHVWRVEHGRRRTRKSTLAHIALAIADESRRSGGEGDTAEILATMLDAGGEAIAPESVRSERSIPRKKARKRRENVKADLRRIVERLDGPEAAAALGGGPEYKLRERLYSRIGI